MNTITFSEKNSFDDFGLLLKSREFGEATPRTNYIDVPARDGVLDFTEAFGEVKYQNRTHIFVFQYVGSDNNWQATISALNNYINGQKHKIYAEADYYWVGRCFVKSVQSNNGIREIEIEADCEPYKLRLEDTVIEARVIETNSPNLFNYDNNSVYNITNNYDGTFTLNTTEYSGTVSVAGSIFAIGKTYKFSQNVSNLQDSGGSALEFRVLMYHADGTNTANSVAVNGDGQYSLELTPTKAVTSADIMVILKGNNTTTITGVISNIEIKEAQSTGSGVIKTIINDRKTVTPRIKVIEGAPILSWTDKKTGASFTHALGSDFDNKILDFRFYEGQNIFTLSGTGAILLTYREASL